jgi:thiamine biosynthesis lipoprotein
MPRSSKPSIPAPFRNNLLVEIGGEVRAHGRNASGGPWRIALEKPESGQRAFHAVLNLSNAAMATSGNYRRFWEKDGVRYGHSLNPKTGYPEKSRLLSATVVSADCATSDAWATACMVMGLEEAVAVLEDDPAVEGYLMYLDAEGTLSAIQSTGFGTMVGSVEPIDP